MAKKNKHASPPPRNQVTPPTFSPTQSAGTPVQEQPVSQEQVGALQALGTAAQEARAAHDIPPDAPEPVPPPAGITLRKAIENAWEAERILGLARKKAEEAARKAEQAEQTLGKERQEFSRREKDLEKKRTELDAHESKLIERDLMITDRERNAEEGFLAQRRRLVAPLEDQIKKLRGEAEELAAVAEKLRTDEEAAFRRRLEARAQDWQREEEQRSIRWKLEEDAHAKRLAEGREENSSEIAEERRRAQAELARRSAEQRDLLLAEEKSLASQRAELVTKEQELRRTKNDLSAEREILEEDKRGFDSKVARFSAVRVAQLEAELGAEKARLLLAEEERQRYWKELEARRELDRRFGEQSPEQALERLRQGERRIEELEATLRERPGRSSGIRLAELEKERSQWHEDRHVLEASLANERSRGDRLRIAAVELESLRRHKEALEASNHLLGQAIEDLRAQVDRYTKADKDRNPMDALVALDQNGDLRAEARTSSLGDAAATLKDFARSLQHRIARSLPNRELYYSEADIRCFLGGLAMSRLLLLHGISGTGKTSLPLAFGSAVGTPAEVVPVQAGWRDRQDLIGYYNAFHHRFYATNFLQALYRAGTPAFRDRPFLIVLDEINLSRVEQFFADFLSALEQTEDRRQLTLLEHPIESAPKLMSEGRHLPIPPNVWFVGTANHDETTTEFADKTYDRAHIMELPRRDRSQRFKIEPTPTLPGPLSYKALQEAFDAARQKQRAPVTQVLDWLGSTTGIAPLLERRFRVGWGNRLERDVEHFVPVVIEAGGKLGEAVDHLLATKVLRKLRDRHDVHATGLEELRKELDSSWISSDARPERCLLLLDRELSKKRAEEADA